MLIAQDLVSNILDTLVRGNYCTSESAEILIRDFLKEFNQNVLEFVKELFEELESLAKGISNLIEMDMSSLIESSKYNECRDTCGKVNIVWAYIRYTVTVTVNEHGGNVTNLTTGNWLNRMHEEMLENLKSQATFLRGLKCVSTESKGLKGLKNFRGLMDYYDFIKPLE